MTTDAPADSGIAESSADAPPTESLETDTAPQLSAQADDTPQNVTILTDTTTTWADGVYFANSSVFINDRIEVSGIVTLTWNDQASLSIGGGIHVPHGSKLIIDGNSDSVICHIWSTEDHASDAIIGGNANEAAGVIEIRNGHIQINRSAALEILPGAVIGNGESGSDGEVLIKGGNVNISTEFYDRGGAGIGNGAKASGISVVVSGGTIHVDPSDNASAIGGGFDSGDATILITGGFISMGPMGAADGDSPAIGAPLHNDSNRQIDVTITGGEIHAFADFENIVNNAPLSIGGLGSGNLTLGSQGEDSSGSCVLYLESIDPTLFKNSSDWNGIVFLGLSGTVYGNVFLAEELYLSGDFSMGSSGINKLIIPIGASLVVPEGIDLLIDGDALGCLENNGTLRIKGKFEGNNGGEEFIAFDNNGVLFLDSPSSFLDDTSSWNSVVFIGDEGTLYGNPVLNNDLHVESGQTLTIPADKTLVISKDIMLLDDGAIVNNGTVRNEGTIDGVGTFENNGVLEVSGAFFPQLVEFDSAGGSKIDSMHVNRGNVIGYLISDPIRNGFRFDGWYADGSYRTPWSLASDKVERPITLYAKWIAEPAAEDAPSIAAPTLPIEPADYVVPAGSAIARNAELVDTDVPHTGDTSLPFPAVLGILALLALLRVEGVRRKMRSC